LTEEMNEEMAEESTKAAQRFYGKAVRIIIEEDNGQESKRRKT
jgi:hypothetical protein